MFKKPFRGPKNPAKTRCDFLGGKKIYLVFRGKKNFPKRGGGKGGFKRSF